MDADTRLEAEARREALSRAVSNDLEAIFRPAPTAPAPQPGKVQSFVPDEGRRREGSQAKLGALAAAALAGLALGAVIMNPSTPGPKPLTPASVAVIAPAASPTPAPSPSPSPALPVQLAQAPPAPAPAPISPAPHVSRAKAAAPAARPAKIVKAKAKAAPVGRCGRLQGSARARCAYPAVIAADRRLRTAYAKATRAGVSRQRLVSVRSRWASLRHQADDQPTRVIVAYDNMAADLTRAARQARS